MSASSVAEIVPPASCVTSLRRPKTRPREASPDRHRQGRDAHKPSRIIFIDDDNEFREDLSRRLAEAGFETSPFSSTKAALRYLRAGGDAALLLLDWNLRSMSGIRALKLLRQAGLWLPVVVLTTLSGQIYEESALAAGAADYVIKLRSHRILIHRLNLILGRWRNQDRNTLSLRVARHGLPSGLRLLPRLNRADWRGQHVQLTPAEFRVVQLLARRTGGDVTYGEIAAAMGGRPARAATNINSPAIRTLVKSIRHKFRRIDAEFDRIETYSGVGYGWLASSKPDG